MLLLTQKFQHAKMVDGKDLYQHLIMMSNPVNKLEEVTMSNAMEEDFMTIVWISFMGILQYVNIIKIVMNGTVLERADLINKLTTTIQHYKGANERPSKLHTSMQALDKRIRKKKKKEKKKGVCFNYKKEGHFAKECQSKLRRILEEQENKVIGVNEICVDNPIGREPLRQI